MSLKLSKRHEWVLQSEIRNMSIECDRLGGINLSQGVCDLEVPSQVRFGAKEAIDKGFNTYTRYDGLAEIRAAIAHKQLLFTGQGVVMFQYLLRRAGKNNFASCTTGPRTHVNYMIR